MIEKMQEYAELLIEKGVNLQPGQMLIITSSVESADLARLCTEAAYKRGAKTVDIIWNDDSITRLKYLHAEKEVFETFPEWHGQMYDYFSDNSAAKLYINGQNPELLSGVDPTRIQKWQQAAGKRLEAHYTLESSNKFPWCIGAYATPAWARMVFPDLDEEKAVEELWDSIFDSVRVKGDGNASQRWTEFLDSMEKRIGILNGYGFKYLEYKNSLGTDLVAELPEGHYWSSASMKAATGQTFIANMPTEEIYTLPKYDGVNGRVYATKPLVLNGNIIDNFNMTLKDGKIISFEAEKGYDILKQTLEIDEGASFLGEVALVPYDSPISNSSVLFYSTLFDENASCHLAFGDAVSTIEGADNLSKDEKKAMGINKSFIHEDFMIGSPDLSIVGVTKDGERVQVFKDGNFAF